VQWSLEVTRPARKDLAGLPARDAYAVRRALDRLTPDLGTADLRKLAGHRNQWRLRVGRWRAILELDNAAGLIRVMRVLPRERAYRD
jgi:mRNA-degrading endonuclease RelE of RelBE toxin-antitoxin system